LANCAIGQLIYCSHLEEERKMCLAIPGKVKKIFDNNTAEIEIGGIVKNASLDLIPQVVVGDYVLLHAGFAIQVIDQKEALEIFRAWEGIID
jgi:hydrogenase expression/formation protein HypC